MGNIPKEIAFINLKQAAIIPIEISNYLIDTLHAKITVYFCWIGWSSKDKEKEADADANWDAQNVDDSARNFVAFKHDYEISEDLYKANKSTCNVKKVSFRDLT